MYRFISAPTRECLSCHAATVVETADGRLLAAWFGGTYEGHPDVAIWTSTFDHGEWSPPVKLIDERDVPLWNPVLFRDADGVVWLFYKVGPTIPAWTGAFVRSSDGGRSWSHPKLLPAGLLGPSKNKPIVASNGEIVSGTSAESWRSWTCWVEVSSDGGRSWARYGPITAPGWNPSETGPGGPVSAAWADDDQQLILPQQYAGVIQPTVWEYARGRLRMLMRTTQHVGFVCVTDSDDFGRTWSEARMLEVECPNSGLDAVRLRDGRIALVCNPSATDRTPLSLLISADNGETWRTQSVLESGAGEFSYPSIIESRDGTIHTVYTYNRTHIRHAMIDRSDL
ncbi:MAG: exo-alpha-sialidase [Chloroflexi bacterium]|nr:exo-alpha-sialidase [Chloroflexota bacterium]